MAGYALTEDLIGRARKIRAAAAGAEGATTGSLPRIIELTRADARN